MRRVLLFTLSRATHFVVRSPISSPLNFTHNFPSQFHSANDSQSDERWKCSPKTTQSTVVFFLTISTCVFSSVYSNNLNQLLGEEKKNKKKSQYEFTKQQNSKTISYDSLVVVFFFQFLFFLTKRHVFVFRFLSLISQLSFFISHHLSIHIDGRTKKEFTAISIFFPIRYNRIEIHVKFKLLVFYSKNGRNEEKLWTHTRDTWHNQLRLVIMRMVVLLQLRCAVYICFDCFVCALCQMPCSVLLSFTMTVINNDTTQNPLYPSLKPTSLHSIVYFHPQTLHTTSSFPYSLSKFVLFSSN